MRTRWPLRLVWLPAAGLACWAAVSAVTSPYNQCDNVVGTCVRDRQLVAIAAIQVTDGGGTRRWSPSALIDPRMLVEIEAVAYVG